MEKEKKKVAITCDDYKLEKFKKELIKAGFPDFEVVRIKKDVSALKVACYESDYPKIGNICADVENYFKGMKN